MAFDVTNPRRVSFQQDYNARNFDIDPSRACGPRRNPKPPGCARAPASCRRERARPGRSLLIVNHELSDSFAAYELDTGRSPRILPE